jgi:hypothetical protein
MKNPAYEQIQARKVKARLRMLQHAQRVSGNISQTCRFFGVSRALDVSMYRLFLDGAKLPQLPTRPSPKAEPEWGNQENEHSELRRPAKALSRRDYRRRQLLMDIAKGMARRHCNSEKR